MWRAFGLFTGGLTFLYLALVLNPLQMLSLLVYPVAPGVTRRINRWCARSIWGLWVIMAENLHGIRVSIRGDRLPWRENAFVIPNHQSMADVLLLLCVAWRCGRTGDLKWFVKDVIKYIPGPGWGMWLLDCIFVKRDWLRDREGIMKLFHKYRTRDIPMFLVSFLEGTRRTPAKLAEAQAYAQANALSVPTHTLVPRTKGFVATMTGLRDHLDAVYDVTLAYPDFVPTLADCFGGRVSRVEIHVRRYAVDELPTDDAALAAWAVERFEAKDRMMAAFAETQTLPGAVVYPRARWQDWLRPEDRADLTSITELPSR